MQMYDPPSPGEILTEDHLKPLNIDPLEFANRLGVDASYINDVLASRSAINADLALRLSIALGTTAEIWLGLQQQYDLWQARQNFTAELQPYEQPVVA